jgi:hypothetical protein
LPGTGVVERRRESGVIGIRVREHDRLDIAGHVTERRQIRFKPGAETWHASVDRGQPPAVLDEVPVDELVAQAVDAGDDVWHGIDRGILLV